MTTEIKNWCTIEIIGNWEELQSVETKLQEDSTEWIYRGQRDSSWLLKSSLERIARERYQKEWSVIPNIEKVILREFKRYYHLYSQSIPAIDDDVEWLSLMQHYGAPTRMLDWTYSFYVALFFAIEALYEGQSAAIWSIDHKYCWDKVRAQLPRNVVNKIDQDEMGGKKPDTMRKIIESVHSLVVPLNPFRLNDRLSVQQGIFLAPLDVSRSFMENLYGLDKESELKVHLKKFTIKTSHSFTVKGILKYLHRMNINRRSLFPGLDGFAQSLSNKVSFFKGTLFAQNK